MSSIIEIYEIIKYKGVYYNKTLNKWNVKSYSSASIKKITSKLKNVFPLLYLRGQYHRIKYIFHFH